MLDMVRMRIYGILADYGDQNDHDTWVTGEEYRRFFRLMELLAADHVLDVRCGSGGRAMFLAREVGCRVTGLDVNEVGIQAGLTLARAAGMQEKVRFQHVDVQEPLPFPDRRLMPSCAWTRCATFRPAARYSCSIRFPG